MIILHLISLVALVAILVYIISFFIKYHIIPQSLSVTAEWTKYYRWWQVTICSVMGWLSYYFPTIYSFEDYGFWPILASAGVAGLSLAGYYSYFPGEEKSRDLFIHKIGSFSGAVCLCLFYVLGLGRWEIIYPLAICLILGIFIRGSRYGCPKDNSIIFWEELGIIGIVGYDIVQNFIQLL